MKGWGTTGELAQYVRPLLDDMRLAGSNPLPRKLGEKQASSPKQFRLAVVRRQWLEILHIVVSNFMTFLKTPQALRILCCGSNILIFKVLLGDLKALGPSSFCVVEF